MSHFYGSMQGSRGEATRCGTKSSGMSGHIRGWSIGGRVELWHNSETGKDEVRIYKTNGSNGYGSGDKLLGVFKEGEDASE